MDQELSDRLAQLEADSGRLAQLEAELTRLREAPRRWRRLGALGSVLAVVAVALVASAGAAPTTDTTAVDFVSIPAKKVMSANSIPAGATESATVIGGTTTVPSNATTVRLEVTVKGAAAGTISLFPAGNEAGGAGHTVSWAAGGSTTATKAENVGLSNKVSVKNSSTKAAVVTLTITGYSTQVTAGDINSSGGSTGQVLTDTGEGATWQNLPAQSADSDKLDGFDSTDFARPIAQGMHAPIANLTAGNNHILGPAFVPSASGECQLTVSLQVDGPGAPTSSPPYFRIAVQRGANPPADDTNYGHYLSNATTFGHTADITRSAVVQVTQGQATRLGAFVGNVQGDWVGRLAFVHAAFVCLT